MRKEMICIGCPMGCYLTVDYKETEIQVVSGNRCKVGLDYAKKEVTNSQRTLTTTVKVTDGDFPLVSVKTNKPLTKGKLFDAMDLLAKVEVDAPIKIGDIIFENLFGSGVDVVATKNVARKP